MKLGVQRSREGHQRGEVQKLAPEMCMWREPECGERRPRRKKQRQYQRVSQEPGPGRVASSQNHWVGNEEEKGSSSKSCSGPAKQRLTWCFGSTVENTCTIHTYLSKGAFTFSQEVIIAQLDSFVVDVINPKFQFLNHFKVVINNKCLGEFGVQAILNPFCALNLYSPHQNKKSYLRWKVHLFIIFIYYMWLNIGMIAKRSVYMYMKYFTIKD